MAHNMTDTSGEAHHLLHSYCIRPKVRFELQAEGEHVILLLRKQPIVQIPWVFNAVVLLLLLIVFDFFASILRLTPGQVFYANFFWVATVLSYVYFNILQYIFNVGIITNIRVVDIDFHSILFKEISATKLSQVEDVTAKSSGYFSTIFDYGDVHIQTAAENPNLEFVDIPHPADVSKIINDLMPGHH